MQVGDYGILKTDNAFKAAFAFLEFGYASALAWVMFAILLVLTVVQLRLGRRRAAQEEQSWA